MGKIRYKNTEKNYWDKDYYVPLRFIDEETHTDMEVFYAFKNVWISVEQIAEFYSIPVETVEKVLGRLEKNKKKDYDKFSLECNIEKEIDGVHSEVKEIRYGFYEVTRYFGKRKEGGAPLAVKKFFWWYLNILNRYGVDPEDEKYYEELRKNPPKKPKEHNISLPFIGKILNTTVTNFRFIVLILALFAILGILAYYNFHSGYGALLVNGEDPQLTYKSLLSIFGIIFAFIWIIDRKKAIKDVIVGETNIKHPWINRIIIAIVVTVAYSYVYRLYYNDVKENMLKNGYECKGQIFAKDEIGYGRTAVRVGIDGKHTFRHIVNNKTASKVNIGDPVKLRVSNEFSRVNKVIDWEGRE